MRVWGEGESAITNPHLSVRLRFRKLYEDYKPPYVHWKVRHTDSWLGANLAIWWLRLRVFSLVESTCLVYAFR